MKRMSVWYMAGLLAVATMGYAQTWDSADSGSSIGMPGGSAPSGGGSYKNQILDAADKPAYDAKMGYILPADFGRHGSSGVMELQGDWEFAYFRDVLSADVDLNLLLRSYLFTSGTDLHLPNQVTALALDAGATWRFEDATGLQFRGKPGFYSDMGGLADGLNMPVSLAVVKAFNNELSGLAGLEWRPGFDRPIMPLLTMEMLIQDTVRLRLGVPENRITYYAAPDFAVYAGLDWENTTFALSDSVDGVDRKSLTLDDYRYYVGGSYQMPGQVRLIGELGQVYDRNVTIKYDGARKDDDVDADAALFVRFGLLGMF